MNPWKWLTSKFKHEPLAPVTREYKVAAPPSNVEVQPPYPYSDDDWSASNPFVISKPDPVTVIPVVSATTTSTVPVTVSEVPVPEHPTTADITVITDLPEKTVPEREVNEVNKD